MTSEPSMVTVWPEFGPPHRTSQGEFERLARRATTLPFPSEPYCPPTTIVAGMVTNISGRRWVVKRPYTAPKPNCRFSMPHLAFCRPPAPPERPHNQSKYNEPHV